LIEPDKALVVQKRLLLAATTDVRFTRGSLRAIAEEAQKAGTHGRALREIVEQVLEPIVYDEPTVAIITAEMVRNRNAEIDATNREDDGVKVAAKHDFIVADDEVEATMATAQAAALEQRKARGARTGRELMVVNR
jgi:ATP-dependent protease Clp ATPase subunit